MSSTLYRETNFNSKQEKNFKFNPTIIFYR